MTLAEKIEEWLLDLEDTVNISTTSSSKLVQWYYMSLGVSPTDSFSSWMLGLSNGDYPAYGSITRAIRKCRQNKPRWRKESSRKSKEQDNVKSEVGY